jgi:proteasome lid subunit RPN8/RPN11
VRVSRRLLDEIVAHSREEAPNECCGLIGGGDQQATTVYRANNLFASPTRFEIDDLAKRLRTLEEAGEELVAMYHSHTRSEAFPSETDRNLAWGWPGVVWIICSLTDPDDPDVKAFTIDEEKRVHEVELEIAEHA